MAKGNWNPTVIDPSAKCRLCGFRVRDQDFVRLDGINPAHRTCAQQMKRAYSEGRDVYPEYADGDVELDSLTGEIINVA